jgi:HK97 family phage major capsid protein
MSDVISIIKANFDARQEAREELVAIDRAATGRALTADEEKKADELRSKVAEIDQRLESTLTVASRGAMDVDPRLAAVLGDTGAGVTDPESRSLGLPRFEFPSDEIRGLFEQVRGGASAGRLEARAVTAYPTITQQNVLGVVPIRREPTRLAEFMPTQSVESATASYWAATTAATAAATVAAGGAKPESTPGWTAATATIRKIAHWTQVPKEALDDFPSFEQIVRDEMTAGVINTENSQLAAGDGTGTNLTGLTAASGIQTYAPGSAEARTLSILHAITMIRTGTAFLEADAVILNPADWEIVQKWTNTAGDLLTASSVAAATERKVWGVPVILTTGMTAGTALVAALAASTVVFQRELPNVFVDPYSASTNNLVKFICEERLGLGVIRPTGIVKITFNGSI